MIRLVRLAGAALAAAATAAQTHTHGTMVGSVDHTAAIVWTRASATADVSVVYATRADFGDAIETPPRRVAAARDFTFKETLGGLLPDTDYYYRTRVADPANASSFELSPIGRFRTAPDPSLPTPAMRFVFSGDVHRHAENDIFDVALRNRPHFYVSLGDMPYADGATTLPEFWDKHKENRADPTLQQFLRSVAVLATWDDHEVVNDWDNRVDPMIVANGIAAFRDYLPVAGSGEIYRSLRWGRDLELFLLDCRSHRGNNEAPDLPDKHMLGDTQLQWLLQALSASTATFKIVCSSVPLRYGNTGLGVTGDDHWDGYMRERDRILQHVLDARIANVLWITADQHWAAAHHHREGIREYIVGPMSNGLRLPNPRPEPEVRWHSVQRSFGIISFDPRLPEPGVTVQIWGVDGELYRDIVAARTPADWVVETGDADAGFVIDGGHFLRGGGARTELPARPPGYFAVHFQGGADSAWRPAPLRFAVNPGERVFAAGRAEDHADLARPVLFRDGFEAPLDSRFTVVDEGDIDGPSAWFTSGGQLVQSSNIYGLPFDPALPHKPGTFLLFGDPGWRDYTVRVRANSRDDDNVGIMFRYQDPDNYYRFMMHRQYTYVRLERKRGGSYTVLGERRDFRYQTRTWYDLAVAATGDRLQAFIDGEQMFDVTDSGGLAAGRAALYVWGNLVTLLDDLEVRAGDAMAPAVAPMARDTFNDGSLTGFEIVDTSSAGGPSQWQEQLGLLQQNSDVGGGDPAPSALPKPGTIAVTGSPTWTDYYVGVDCCNRDDDAFGLVFRYRGRNDHYRFAWDAERRYRRLTRVVNGSWSTLWEDDVAFAPGLWHHLAVEVTGERIRVFVDGVELCDVRDASHPSGRVGLYTWQSAGVEFDDLTVRPAYQDTPSLAGRTSRGRIELHGVAPRSDPGDAYVLAMSLSRTTGLPLALFGSGDPRVLPLDPDQLFLASLNPFPGLYGFRGFTPAGGAIDASVDLPASTGVSGLQFFVAGFTLRLPQFRVIDVLPAVEMRFD